MSDEETYVVPVQLNNGTTIRVEVRDLGGRQKVNDLKSLSLNHVMASIEAISGELSGILTRLGPQRASVEMGFEVAAESGQLTALLVKGSGKATINVTLEWNKSPGSLAVQAAP